MPLLDNSRHLFSVWKASTRASLVREMEFRANFIAGIIRQLVWLSAFVITVETIFANTNSLAGWQRSEVLIILALSRLIEGTMSSLFISNIMNLPQLVRDGKFDFHLTKPVPVQFFTAFRRTNIEQIGNVIGGLVLFIYALSIRANTISAAAILSFLVITCAGVVIYYSLLIISATLVFYLDRLEFLWSFNTLLSEPLTVPFDVFPTRIQFALTYFVPIAFVVFVPAEVLTNHLHSPFALPTAIVLATIFITLANLAWRAGLVRYSSASS
jgi:ABC-2 type transport system permease protein